ncbi:Sialic acid permease [Dermatophilus congolensis]|uniref:Sialic acid permease n=1 Tax=Dermatophilus congolensis TaxID=1863 RepID=A0A239V738_9MICO|nr:MFS transporter [Dermatophilus congolensis]SNV17882.1 Sialic acid permease [Dermatophilus congolensis]
MTTATAPSTSWRTQLTPTQWKSFWAAWVGYLLDGFDFVMITLVLTEIGATFQVSAAMTATLVSAAFIARWFGGLLLGAVGDRFGRKEAMVISILLYAGGSLLCAIAPWFWVIFAARVCIGMGMAGEYGSSATYVIESWPTHLRNKASGFLISGFSIGAGITAQVYALIEHLCSGTAAEPYAWRILFALGIIPIGLALWLRRALPEAGDYAQMRAEQERLEAAGHTIQRTDMVSILFARTTARTITNVAAALVAFSSLVVLYLFKDNVSGGIQILLWILVAAVMVSYMVQFEGRRWPVGVGVMLTVFAAFMYSWPLQALLPTYYKQALGMSTEVASNLVTATSFGAAAGCIMAGFLGDRFGTRKAYWCSLLFSEVLILPVFLISRDMAHSSFWWIVLLGVFIFVQQMFGQGIAGLLPKFIANYFSVDKRAAGLGFSYNVGALGGAIAPVLGIALAGDPKTGSGGLLPATWGLGWTLCILSFTFTAIVIVMIAFNFPYQLQKLFAPEAIRPTDRADFETAQENVLISPEVVNEKPPAHA